MIRFCYHGKGGRGLQRSEKRKRTELIGVRLTPGEHEQLSKKADALGVSCAPLGLISIS